MNRIDAWNPNINVYRMSRIGLKDVDSLCVGMTLYYINMNDDVIGAVYEAKIIDKNDHMFILECTPVIEAMPCSPIITSCVQSHIESMAFIDLQEISLQYLYSNLVYKSS